MSNSYLPGIKQMRNNHNYNMLRIRTLCSILLAIAVVRIVTNAQPVLHMIALQEDNIIGSWSLVIQAFDNSNGKLDEEERKKGTTGKHFYQFNSDGTCLIHTMKLKGSYELKK